MKLQGWICLYKKEDKKKLLEFLKKEGFDIKEYYYSGFDCDRDDVFILGRNYPTQFEFGACFSRGEFTTNSSLSIYRTNKEYTLRTLFSETKLMETE